MTHSSRLPRVVAFVAATLLGSALTLDAAAQAGPTAAEVRVGVAEAIALLVPDQEIYLPDSWVGTLSPAALAQYQLEEEARLERIRRWCAGVAEEWPYEGVYRVAPGGVIPAGYRVGGTSIVCSALLHAPGWSVDVARRDAVARSIDFLLDILANDPSMGQGPKVGYDVRGWGHTYALQFLLEAMDAGIVTDPVVASQVTLRIQWLVDALELNETSEGGWNYANDVRISPFMTGPALLALYLAKARGYVVNDAVVNRALDAVEGARTSEGTYAYSGTPSLPTPMPGSSARSCAAELALSLAGRATDNQVRVAVHGFIRSWEFLLERKSQQGTHVGTYSIAPYYFFFGHTYAALAIERLPAGERGMWRAEIRRLLWETREVDGGWNDRVFPRSKSYGTAMSLLALSAPTRPALASW